VQEHPGTGFQGLSLINVQPGWRLALEGRMNPSGLYHPIFTFPSLKSLMLQQQGGLPVRDGFAPVGKSASGWREEKGREWTHIDQDGASGLIPSVPTAF